MNNITIRFGGNTLSVQIAAGSNVGCLRTNRNYAATLGFSPDGVEFLVNGTLVNDQTVLSNGDVVHVQTRSHQKAI